MSIANTDPQAVNAAILDGARKAREKVLAEYSHDRGRITSPGKFEGEPVFAPHFWGMGLEGFADDDDGKVYKFKFKNGDAELEAWPELKEWLRRRRVLRMFESDSGFVKCF